MIRDLFNGMGVKLDPSLKFLKPETVFQFPKKDERLVVTGKGEMQMSVPNGPDLRMNYYQLQDNNHINFRIIDDVKSGVVFLYRELMSSPLNGEPPFIASPELNLEIENKLCEFKDYSQAVLKIYMDSNRNLVRIYARDLDQDTQEYLWCEINNNQTVKYFVGIDIHSSQIII